MKNIEFTGKTKVIGDITLKQIRAKISFGTVLKGQIGGWIETENSIYGNAWVSGNVQVYGNAWVKSLYWLPLYVYNRMEEKWEKTGGRKQFHKSGNS